MQLHLRLLKIFLVASLLCFCNGIFGQVRSNLQRKKIAASGVVRLDASSIVPNTLYIPGIDSSYYQLDPINGVLTWKRKMYLDSVDISYRTFPVRWNDVSQRYSYDSIINISLTSSRALNKTAHMDVASDGIFNFGKIDYNGSFGRSMSFGNSQDAVFNSQFNMQMSGYIGDSIQLTAAISDNNIPIQPDGTTQQINEFDKILLEFKKKNWQIDLGDVDLRQTSNYYLSFYKRLQGISYQQQVQIGKNITNKTTFSGAVAKGKFARNVLSVTEGNQGPYQLSGNNGETSFAVLAGTEKVFMDGVQLQRGEDQDYIIDYNTAQVTFTQKHLISPDRRIQVEFEYSDKNYLNYMFYINNETEFNKKLKLRVAAFSNGDAKNSPINQTLDDSKRQFLANIGDSVNQAFYPIASIDTFNASRIMYLQRDTVVNDSIYKVFIYSTNPDSAKYDLAFSYVGGGNGNYILTSSDANGRVYQWVAPVNGVRQGMYEPAEFLVTPKRQSIFTVGADYLIDSGNAVSVQLATSKYDINTFSRLDKGNDNGQAGKLTYAHRRNWQSIAHQYQLTADAGYEFNSLNFKTVERLRSVEFTRDWGLTILTDQASEKIGSMNLLLQNEKKDAWSYSFGSYNRGDGFNAFRNAIHQQQTIGNGWMLDNQISLTTAKDNLLNINYLKPSFNINKIFTSWHNYAFGAGYLMEKNTQRYKQNDSISYNSFSFETINAFFRSDQSKSNNWSLTYYTRRDDTPDSTKWKALTRSNNINLSGQLASDPNNQIRFNATYRNLKVSDTTKTSSRADNTVLGRVEYLFRQWKDLLTGNVLYEIGSGQEQKKEFTYIEVTAGQGQYTWNDYNNDGIAQINEFEIAAYKDQAKYIRVYSATSEYVKANYTQFNYSVLLNPRIWAENDSARFKHFLSKFNLQSSLQTNKKEIARGGVQFNPFQGSIADTSIINLNYIWSNTLSFNRSDAVWGVDVTNFINYNKSLLTYGTEGHGQNTWTIKGRVNVARKFTIETRQQIGKDNLENSSYANRNYHLNILSTEPTFTYTANTRFRVSLGYQYGKKTNDIDDGGEKAISNILRVESKFNAVNSTVIGGKFILNKINFTGDANSTVGYILLDGLSSGQNLQWSLNMTKRMLKNLELNIQYDGRRPAASRVIHIGTVSIRAVL